MMSRRRIATSIAGLALAGTACASSGTPTSSWFTPAQATAPTPSSGAPDALAVLRAGGYVREEGPRVSVYADVTTDNGARLVRANFHLDDDAYVLVGHIDADGVLRIEFPENPEDNGFAHGHASYQTAEFFAGFAGQYRARFANGLNGLRPASTYDSYDGGLGYVFVIASWQPMHFEKFSSDGRWDSFEINDADYLRDPRPAVYELASLLAGTNPSTYTVRFASVLGTQNYSHGYYADAYDAQLCSGFGYGFLSGFTPSPFGFSSFNPIATYGYGQSFWWRGSQYLYSTADDCYYRSGTYFPFGYPGYRYGWTTAQAPPQPGNPGVGRVIGIDRIRKLPLSPQPGPMHLAPGGATDVGATNTTALTLAPDNTSPQYRTRGLVSHQDPAGGGFQGLVIRGGNYGQSQTSRDGAVVRRAPAARGEAPAPSSPRMDSPRVETPRNDAPRAAPQPRIESPRMEAPRVAPPARVEAPAPRVEAPRSEPPRSPPPPASSSSSGKPPGGKN